MSKFSLFEHEIYIGERPNDCITKIVLPNFAKRLFAALFDFIMWISLSFVLYSFVGLKIAEPLGYYDAQIDSIAYQYFSGITEIVDDDTSSNFRIFESDNWEDYSARVQAFYFEFLCMETRPDNSVLPAGNSKNAWKGSPEWNDDIVLESGEHIKPKDFYTIKWYNETVLLKDSTDTLFTFVSDQIGTPKTGVTDEQLLVFFRNAFNDEQVFLANTNFYKKIRNTIVTSEYVSAISSFIISFTFFYILLPLIYKDGQTLSKHILNLEVISSTGYKAKKSQIIIRQVCLFFEFALSMLSLGILLFIDFLIAIFSTKHLSAHDFVANTIVLDSKKSVIFQDQNAEISINK